MSGPVNDLQTNSPDDFTLVISWRPPTTPNGNIFSYTVRIENLRDGTTLNHNAAMTSLTENDLGKQLYRYPFTLPQQAVIHNNYLFNKLFF